MARASWNPGTAAVHVSISDGLGERTEAVALTDAQRLLAQLTAAVQQGNAASATRTCRACLGRGATNRESPCPRCVGSGREREA